MSALLEIVDSSIYLYFIKIIDIRHGINDHDNERQIDESDELDSSSLVHRLTVIANMIVAFDGIPGSDTGDWIKQMQELINFCNDEASSIRESLFTSLEDSFFFCNEFVDVPIFNDEQYINLI